MKAFSLEEYLKNPSKKVVTRDGRAIKRILCTDARGIYPIVALVDCSSYDSAIACTKDGKFYAYDETSVNDLFFIPEKNEGWFNIYLSEESGFFVRQTHPYQSKAEAEEIAKANPKTFFATAKIEWEE